MEKMKKLFKERKDVKLQLSHFKKIGEVEDYNVYEKTLSFRQRELLIDFINWRSNNQREIIIEGYSKEEEKEIKVKKEQESILSDITPLGSYTISGSCFNQLLSLWSFIFPNIFSLGLTTLLLFQILLYTETTNKLEPPLTLFLAWLLLFVAFPTFTFISGYKTAKLLFFIRNINVPKTKRQNFQLENRSQSIGILTLFCVLLVVISFILSSINLENGLRLTNIFLSTLIILCIYFPLLYSFSLFVLKKQKEKRNRRKIMYTTFSSIDEKSIKIDKWLPSKLSLGNREKTNNYIPKNVKKWEKVLQPFFFKDFDESYKLYLNFKYFTNDKAQTKINRTLKKSQIYYPKFLFNLSLLIISLLLYFFHFSGNLYYHRSLSIILLIVFFIETSIKVELVFFDDIYVKSIKNVNKQEYVTKWSIIDNKLYMFTSKNRTLKSTYISKTEKVSSSTLIPDIFVEKNEKDSTILTFENSKHFILFGYEQSNVEKMRKKVQKAKI